MGESVSTYVDVMITSLKKKVILLEKIENTVLEQEKELQKPKPDLDVLNDIEDRLAEYVVELEKAEDGFTSIYQRVKEAIGDQKEVYKTEIQEMQSYIREITNQTVKIQAQQVRNQQRMKIFFDTKKREIRQFHSGKRSVAQYSQHGAAPLMGQSFFLNHKK